MATNVSAYLALKFQLLPHVTTARLAFFGQRLRESGVIIGQVTLLDRRLLRLNTQIFARVKLNDQSREMQDAFSAHIRQLPEVLECFLMMGSIDFLLRVVTEDIDAY